MLALLLEPWGAYGEGQLRFDKGYLYVAVINNFSQIWAMYCLILFGSAVKEELAPIKPVAKFLCVKAIVFFTFWQGMVIAALERFGYIRKKDSWTTYDADDVAAGLQDFIVCIEMFFFAIAHAHAFPSREYRDRSAERAASWTLSATCLTWRT